LPIPAIAQPVDALDPQPALQANVDAGEAARADHQRWTEFPPAALYDVHVKPALHRFHPDLGDSYVWGFNGEIPGPTFVAYYGTPILVRVHNDLPENHTGYGINETTVHLHNGHTPSESDGFAQDFFGPGFWKDYHYPNIYAGYDQYPPNGDSREALHTLWYHDHRHSYTSPNTYRGLAGLYILFDDIDTGDENDTRASALRLPAPYGVHDIPLILSEKIFCADGQLYSNNAGAAPGGAGGDKFPVNGVIQPYLPVTKRKYRFRVLNSGQANAFTIGLSNGWPFTVIATDGNLLRSPVSATSLQVNVGERFDFVLDFSSVEAGQKIYLTTTRTQYVGASSPDTLPDGITIQNVLMRFDVTGDPESPDPSRVPSVLCEYPDEDPSLIEVAGTRTWDFDLVSGQFLVNNKVFDPETAEASVQIGTAERWILRNKVPLSAWVHPVHIHFEEFRVISRNGAAPSALESGRKDVLVLAGGEEAEIVMRFRDFKGKYVIHCHNMNHEDNFMLVRWDIVDAPAVASATFTPAPKKGELV
jgi:FtsP/CotA-like multicopper oxidase with cupredoxin domain